MTTQKRMALRLVVIPLICTGAGSLVADDLPLLDGKWSVFSATYQMGGPIVYVFQGNSLTIEYHFDGGKDGTEPQSILFEKWTYDIESSDTVHRLKMRSIVEPGQTRVNRCETIRIQNGNIWLDRGAGWESGLRRIK